MRFAEFNVVRISVIVTFGVLRRLEFCLRHRLENQHVLSTPSLLHGLCMIFHNFLNHVAASIFKVDCYLNDSNWLEP